MLLPSLDLFLVDSPHTLVRHLEFELLSAIVLLFLLLFDAALQALLLLLLQVFSDDFVYLMVSGLEIADLSLWSAHCSTLWHVITCPWADATAMAGVSLSDYPSERFVEHLRGTNDVRLRHLIVLATGRDV